MRSRCRIERVLQPLLRDEINDLDEQALRQARLEQRVGLAKLAGNGQKHVIFDGAERRATALQVVCAGMMEVERGSVIDEPEPFVPEKHVGIAWSAIYISDIGIEPDDERGQQRLKRAGVQRIEGDRAGQVVQRQIEARAGPDECLNLRVWF